jgi:uncharacterized protein YegL
MAKRPGGEMATRPLHFIWIVDCSGSMSDDGKIQTVNNAIKDAIPLMRKVADENPNAEVLIRAVKFSNGAQWHHSQPTPIASFNWIPLAADGVTDLGRAFILVADQLKIPPMTDRALPPVLVLLSDGRPSDDHAGGLKILMDQPWGKKAVRISIAIGKDAQLDVLQNFIGNPELKPLEAHNPDALVRCIKWVSTAVVQSASSPASQTTAGPAGGNVPVPAPPPLDNAGVDVW